MAMDRQTKAKWKDEIVERFSKASTVVLAEYSGLTVGELTELRRELRKANAEFRVSKNRIAKRAVEDQGDFKGLIESLKGPTGAVYMYGDVAQATKAVVKFGDDHEHWKVKAAIMDGQLVAVAQLKAVADLPSKEVMLGQILGSLSSPARGLVTTISGIARNLVGVINAIKETKKT